MFHHTHRSGAMDLRGHRTRRCPAFGRDSRAGWGMLATGLRSVSHTCAQLADIPWNLGPALRGTEAEQRPLTITTADLQPARGRASGSGAARPHSTRGRLPQDAITPFPCAQLTYRPRTTVAWLRTIRAASCRPAEGRRRLILLRLASRNNLWWSRTQLPLHRFCRTSRRGEIGGGGWLPSSIPSMSTK